MTRDLLDLALRINLAGSAAILLVLALRHPARRLFGASVAYGLWMLVPLAAAAMLIPARVVRMSAPAGAFAIEPDAPLTQAAAAAAASFDPTVPLTGLWFAGALASLLYLAWRQQQFSRAVTHGTAGPAVVGVLKPRVVTPSDFADLYTPREQQVVLAHEAAHIGRQDSRINALVALARCLAWFNPLVHLMGHALRIDQELACDAQVVARHPAARRTYAEAMLKTQLAAQPLPFGCYWPADSAHPLAMRIRLLAQPAPGRGQRWLGAAAISLVALAGAGAAWATRPAEVVMVPVAETRPVDLPVTLARAETSTPSPMRQVVASRPVPSRAQPAPAPAQTPAPQPNVVPAATVTMIDRPMPARFDPNHRFGAAARRSAVAPGYAVRVLAEMTDPKGIQLVTDMTSYGSQSRFRTGWYWDKGSDYALFTAVVQQGDKFLITVSLDRRFAPETTGSILLADNQAGEIVIAGQTVRVRPTLRRETPEEMAYGRDRNRI